MLDIETSQEGDAVAVIPGNRNFIHGALLHRVKNVYAGRDQIIEQRGVIAAGVQPPMCAMWFKHLADALIVGEKEFMENGL